MAIAVGQPPFILPTTPSAVSYSLHEDASGPDGARQRDQQIYFVTRGDGYSAVVSSSGLPDQTLSLTLENGFLMASNTGPSDDQQSAIEPLGFLVSLVHHQGPIESGQSWTSTTTIDLPGGDAVRVPLAVTAKSVQGDDVTLAATGNGAGVVHAKGHSAKATIDLVLQASFHDGHVVSATTTRRVTAHVPFRTITFTDTWSITS